MTDRPSSTARHLRAMAALTVVAAGIAAATTPAAARAAEDSTIAIAPFAVNGGNEYDWLGTALPNALVRRLFRGGATRFMTLRQVNAALRQQGMRATTVRAEKNARRLARALGADMLVVGTVDAAWPEITVTLDALKADATGPGERVIIAGALDDVFGFEARIAAVLGPAAGIASIDTGADALGTTDLHAWRLGSLASSILDWQSLAPVAADPRAPPRLSAIALEEAQGFARSAVESDSSYTAAWAALAVAEALRGQLPAAREALANAGRADPAAILAGSFVMMREGRNDAAIEILRDTIAAHPGFLHPRGYLGELYALSGRFAEAERTFDAYAILVPRQPWVLAQRGYCRAKLGNIEGALTDTLAALTIVPGTPQLRVELASRYIDARKLERAEDELTEVIAQIPDWPLPRIRLGYVSLLRGDDERTIALTREALAYGYAGQRRRDIAYAHLNLARAYGHQGRIDDALGQLASLRELAPIPLDELFTDARLEALRAHPRFATLIADAHDPDESSRQPKRSSPTR